MIQPREDSKAMWRDVKFSPHSAAEPFSAQLKIRREFRNAPSTTCQRSSATTGIAFQRHSPRTDGQDVPRQA